MFIIIHLINIQSFLKNNYHEKDFILVFAAGTFITAAARQGQKMNHSFDEHNREKNQYSNNYAAAGTARDKASAAYGKYPYSFKERAAELRRINWQFDQKAALISRDRHLQSGEKARQPLVKNRQVF